MYIIMYVYICIYIYIYTYDYKVCLTLAPGDKARVQNGVSGSFLSAVFKDKESEVWTNLSCSFIKGGLLQFPG